MSAEGPLTRLRGRARLGARAAAIAAMTVAKYAHCEFDERRAPDPEARRRTTDEHVRRWARMVLRTIGVELHIEGTVPAPPRGPRLVVSNHRTALDIPVLLSLFGGSILSRGDIADWPLLGASAKKGGTIFVDRSDPRSGAKAIRAIRAKLVENGCVSLFPEGTTFAGDVVRPFQPGSFISARGLDCELIHVGLAYPPGTEFIEDDFADHMANVASRRRLVVGVAIGDGRPMDGAPRVVAPRSHDEVQALVHRARELATGPAASR